MMRFNPKGIYLSVLLLIFACIAQGQVVINEVSAANYGHTMDNFGEYEDWIELYNTSGAAIDLSGYYLSDRINNNTKYQIPEGCTINANSSLLFWCSSLNTSAGGAYHTTFKLTQCDEEPVVFSDPSGNIIDLFEFPFTNQENHSMGRNPDGEDNWVVYMDPTPGAPNSSQAYQPYPERPEFSQDAGFYEGSLTIEISTNQPGSTIHYTLDSSTPNETSPVYSGPIAIDATTVVRAVVISSDPLVPAGFVETNTYFINEEFSVAVLSITGDQILTLLNGSQIEPKGHLEFFDENGLMRDEGYGEYNKHGNDSWAYAQRGIDWITRDEFGYNDAIHHRIFRGKTRDEFQRFMMKAGANDNYPFAGGGHVRDFYVQSLSQVADLEMDERTGEFCIIYANGQYWGLYDIREKVDDHDFTEYYYDQERDEMDFLKTWGGTWAEYGDFDNWNETRDLILDNDMTDPAFYAEVEDRYNTTSLIDYFVLNSYVVAADWLNWNTGWWRGYNTDGGALKWRYILWDMDAVFGHYTNYTGIPDQSSGADICFPGALGNPGSQGHVPIWNALLENEDFRADYVNRMSDLSNSYFSCEFMQQHLDSLVTIMEPEMPRQIDRWGGTYEEWEANVQEIRDFIQMRCEELNENILDCYEDLDGPYAVTVNVDPPGSGNVRVNTIVQQDFPFQGSYFGGITQSYQAIERPGFTWSHWTMDGVEVTPDTDSEEISFDLTQNAELTAHFEASFVYEVTFDVVPAEGGSISVEGTPLNSYPEVLEIPAASPQTIEATAAPGYIFDGWEVSSPNSADAPNDNETALNVVFGGTVKARFVENNNIVLFNVNPAMTGDILLDGEKLEGYPEIRNLPSDFEYNLAALTDVPFYEFSHWEIMNASPTPDSSYTEVGVSFTEDDVVTAYFREIPNYELTFITKPKNVGKIRFGDRVFEEFPHTERYEGQIPYTLEAILPKKYEFDVWDFVMQPNLSSQIYPAIQYTPVRNDTIVLRMEERFDDVFIPTAFSPNGDGVNELIKVQGPEILPDGFEWVIYSRFGDIVFETNDVNAAWNGSEMNSDYYCPVGIYSYHLRYKSAIDNQEASTSGSIMLIR